MPRLSEDVRHPLVVICGPTAAGKTALALRLADRFPVEIISADSRQVYRGMDIGTAKATEHERACVPHHLLDVADPDQEFTAADFARLGRQVVTAIRARGRLPLLVGGTGLYLRALTEGLLPAPEADSDLRRELLADEAMQREGSLHRRLQDIDPALAARLNPRDLVRIVRGIEVFTMTGRRLSELQQEHAFADSPFTTLKLGVTLPREDLYRCIDQRVEKMLAAGLLAEVEGLLARGYPPALKSLRTIGYRECILHLQGQLSLAEATARIQQETRRYAKRQLTWFRRDSSIIWVDSCRESARIHALIEHFYAA